MCACASPCATGAICPAPICKGYRLGAEVLCLKIGPQLGVKVVFAGPPGRFGEGQAPNFRWPISPAQTPVGARMDHPGCPAALLCIATIASILRSWQEPPRPSVPQHFSNTPREKGLHGPDPECLTPAQVSLTWTDKLWSKSIAQKPAAVGRLAFSPAPRWAPTKKLPSAASTWPFRLRSAAPLRQSQNKANQRHRPCPYPKVHPNQSPNRPCTQSRGRTNQPSLRLPTPLPFLSNHLKPLHQRPNPNPPSLHLIPYISEPVDICLLGVLTFGLLCKWGTIQPCGCQVCMSQQPCN